jgi:hypothetical protein
VPNLYHWLEDGMTRIEERRGFEILLEAPPSSQSLWAALVTTADPTLFAELGESEHVCLAYTRERALASVAGLRR